MDAYDIWNVSSAIKEVPKHMAIGYATLKHDCVF